MILLNENFRGFKAFVICLQSCVTPPFHHIHLNNSQTLDNVESCWVKGQNIIDNVCRVKSCGTVYPTLGGLWLWDSMEFISTQTIKFFQSSMSLSWVSISWEWMLASSHNQFISTESKIQEIIFCCCVCVLYLLVKKKWKYNQEW